MMTTINANTAVIDNRDGRTAVLGEKNSKCKTVIVYYDNPGENEEKGKSMSYSTVKKHFSEIEEIAEEAPEIYEEVEKQEAAVEIEEEAEVEAVEAEEIEAEEEEVVEKKERKKRGVKKSFEELVALLPVGENLVLTKMSNGSVAVKCGNKRLFRFTTAGDVYKFVADRVSNFDGIDGAEITERGKKKKVEVKVSEDRIDFVANAIYENAKANGVYIA